MSLETIENQYLDGNARLNCSDETAAQIDEEVKVGEIQKLKKELYTIIADHSGNSYERVEKDSDRDYWMTALEAKEYGMIDDVLVKSMK